jgi:RNA polymerase sigma factor (sigma-70 family)
MEEDAKDVVQETLIVVHQRFSELKTVDDLVAFTFGVLRNKIGNVYRKRERRKRYEAELEEVPEPVYCLDDQFEAAQLDRVIVQAIMKTKPGCQAILMGLHEGFSVGDLSHRFHIPRARMDKQVFHCRQALQRILLEDYRLQV